MQFPATRSPFSWATTRRSNTPNLSSSSTWRPMEPSLSSNNPLTSARRKTSSFPARQLIKKDWATRKSFPHLRLCFHSPVVSGYHWATQVQGYMRPRVTLATYRPGSAPATQSSRVTTLVPACSWPPQPDHLDRAGTGRVETRYQRLALRIIHDRSPAGSTAIRRANYSHTLLFLEADHLRVGSLVMRFIDLIKTNAHHGAKSTVLIDRAASNNE